MEILQEITVWKTDYRVPNHTYILDGSKMVGFIPEGTTEPTMFQSPQTFSRTGRKFTKVGGAKWLKSLPKTNRRAVQGSKGATYYVDDAEGTCTCAGYTYRGYCKHLKNT